MSNFKVANTPVMKAVLLLALLYCSPSFAQNTIRVRAGTPINEAIPAKDLYHYNGFRQGRIVYKDGRTASGQLNYHRLLDEMEFLGPKGDTLAVDHEPTIRLIAIDKDTFCYAAGFVRIVGSTPTVKLAEKRWLKPIDREKYGGYNQTYTAAAITNLSMLDDGRQTHKLTIKENLVLARTTDYYFGDRWDNFVPANKKNLLELFSKHEAALKQYLKEVKVDFQKEKDMQALFAFLVTL